MPRRARSRGGPARGSPDSRSSLSGATGSLEVWASRPRGVGRVIGAGDRPAEPPGNRSRAGPRAPEGEPRGEGEGGTRLPFANSPHRGGRSADENR
ncbi:hypothetical protein [Streptomyces sp. SBT349]|uniref:hypothetical protein n=1 Tax=Streptomyces sp. SBT349 TaxID=1580539 RepID=UPI00066A3C95|nr:hypothetical protein [Streptomyces sp. SBT349]